MIGIIAFALIAIIMGGSIFWVMGSTIRDFVTDGPIPAEDWFVAGFLTALFTAIIAVSAWLLVTL